jgi:DNA-binding MarR family transcriptional regulator
LDRAVSAALAQIDAKGYADRYRGTNRRVYRVGIAVAGRGTVRVRVTHPTT